MAGLQSSERIMEVTPIEWERRKQFVGFTQEDARLLKELHPINEACADKIMEALYERFLSFDETRAFFKEQSVLNRVKSLQKQYFLGLTGGEYGEQYLADRLHIGYVHRKVGLEPRWYMGAYSIYVQLVYSEIMQATRQTPEKAQKMFTSMLKIFTLDKELAMAAYIAPVEHEMNRQAKEILELSIPVIEVWNKVLLVPLIGNLDSRRTEQLTERLLNRIVDTNAQVAVLDITGVPTIDTQTARHLIETVAAVKLLGGQFVLTGVSPAIAQTLVHLGIDWSGIVTKTSLLSGLKYAFDLLNVQVSSKK